MSYHSERLQWSTGPEGARGFAAEWRRVDNMACEIEVLDFLFALVRCAKPDIAFETGTGKGYSSYAIASALVDNEKGLLRTFEPDNRFASEARDRVRELPVEAITWEDVVAENAISQYGSPDLVFLDSAPKFRPQEIEFWLEKPVFLIIHDSVRYQLPANGTSLRTPRGLWFRDARVG